MSQPEAIDARLYHNMAERGFWIRLDFSSRDIKLKDGRTVYGVKPLNIEQQDGTLVMVLSTFDGALYEPIDNFLGLEVVRGDSASHPYETDGELLIQLTYFKVDQLETQPRRIRPSNKVMFGIHGDTEQPSATGGSHRAMGESCDYYLEGVDTRYDPSADSHGGQRLFPFWRIGVWGDAAAVASEYLPEPRVQ